MPWVIPCVLRRVPQRMNRGVTGGYGCGTGQAGTASRTHPEAGCTGPD